MKDCLTIDGAFGNSGSRSHSYGWKAEELIEESRLNVSKLVNCDPREIIFTSGATESDNLAIKGAAYFYKNKGQPDGCLWQVCKGRKEVVDKPQYIGVC